MGLEQEEVQEVVSFFICIIIFISVPIFTFNIIIKMFPICLRREVHVSIFPNGFKKTFPSHVKFVVPKSVERRREKKIKMEKSKSKRIVGNI